VGAWQYVASQALSLGKASAFPNRDKKNSKSKDKDKHTKHKNYGLYQSVQTPTILQPTVTETIR
jgi:hypothetical protein